MVEKGTTNGTVTDGSGNFRLNLTTVSPVLVFTAAGIGSREIAVNGSVMNITLDEETQELNEVVVTALGISKEKKTLGYAVSNLDGQDVRRSGENNAIQSLAAKAPGVQVISSAGTPGASSKILIRGNSTFTGENQPLIVIDGVPIDNETTQSSPRDYPFNENLQGVNNSNRAIDINPDDIESVTILKGPAAAALYGARAGNGAIVYTTKRGRKGEGLGIQVSSSVEFSEVNKLPERQTRFGAGVGGNYIGGADAGPDGIYGTADDVSAGTNQSWGPRLDTAGLPSYDNEANFFETGVTYNNNIELTGGTEKSGVRLAVGDLRQTGVVRAPSSIAPRSGLRAISI
ncbi:TonB-dependent receptor plug domain-containing protein [bacterium]|nr:TonB-dependent receptor plug domain-containing protein [bacterium]